MKTLAKLLMVLLSATFLISFHPAKVSKLSADKSKSYIKYYMYHPAHDWSGICNSVYCTIIYNDSLKVISGVGVLASISCFNSDNANRDSHTLEATEALKYPSVKFASTAISNQDSVLIINGNLTFHNVTKAITFRAKKKYAGKEMTVSGGFSIKLTDYNITPPTLMMAATEDLVKLEFTTVFKVN